MTITFPRNDLMSSTTFSQQKFRLIARQELSRTAGGETYGKDLGPQLWTAEWTTSILTNEDSLDFEAVLNSLHGVMNSFYAYDLRRPYPRSKPDGDFTDDATIYAYTGTTLRLQNIDPGFVLSRGDYLAFDYGSSSRALHQVMETVTASGGGVTPAFAVEPYLRTGVANDIAVTLKKPSALMKMEPGSMDQAGSGALHGTVSLKAFQVI